MASWTSQPAIQDTSTPFAQPLHHQLYSASTCNARSGTASRSVCAITAWAPEWLAGPDNQRSTAPSTPLAQPLHLRPTSASIRNAPFDRTVRIVPRRWRVHGLGARADSRDQTTGGPRHPARRSRNHYYSDPNRCRFRKARSRLQSVCVTTAWALEWPPGPDNHRSMPLSSQIA